MSHDGEKLVASGGGHWPSRWLAIGAYRAPTLASWKASLVPKRSRGCPGASRSPVCESLVVVTHGDPNLRHTMQLGMSCRVFQQPQCPHLPLG
eukprot:3631406-Pyramimonas_sp.AAC.1